MGKYQYIIDYVTNIYEELTRGDLQGIVEAEVLKLDSDKTPREQMQIADNILTEIDGAIYALERDITKDWTR